jgi:hypothetical protein
MQGDGRAGDGQRALGRAAGEVDVDAGDDQAAALFRRLRWSGRGGAASEVGVDAGDGQAAALFRRLCWSGRGGRSRSRAGRPRLWDGQRDAGMAASFEEITGSYFVSEKGVVRSACFSANDREPLER